MGDEVDKWVKDYYKTFVDNPGGLQSVYHDYAVFTRDKVRTSSKNRIATLLTSAAYNKSKIDMAKLKSDFLPSEPNKIGDEDGVIVVASGVIEFPGKTPQKFSQTFRLVRDDLGRFCVVVTVLSIIDP